MFQFWNSGSKNGINGHSFHDGLHRSALHKIQTYLKQNVNFSEQSAVTWIIHHTHLVPSHSVWKLILWFMDKGQQPDE